MPLRDLPRDVWIQKVTPFLSQEDVLQLRCTNRHFKNIFSSNEVWNEFVISRWFNYDDVEIPTNEKWFQYYTTRRKIDDLFLQNLSENNVEQIIEMLQIHGEYLIPCLLKTKQIRDKWNHLSLIYRADQVLLFFKYSKIYEMLKQVVTTTNHNYTYEEILLTLNRFDPRYFDMIKQRNLLRRKVISQYQEQIFNRQNIDTLKFSRTTRSVILIMKIFNKLIKQAKMKSYSKSNDDFLVFPVYCGFNKSGLAYLLVICSICQDLGIDATLTKEHLIKVQDPNYKAGFSHLFVRDNGKIEILGNDHYYFGQDNEVKGDVMTLEFFIDNFFRNLLVSPSNRSFIQESFLNDVRFCQSIFKFLQNQDQDCLKDINLTVTTIHPLHILKLREILPLLLDEQKILQDMKTRKMITSDFILNFHFYKEHVHDDYFEPYFQIGEFVYSERYNEPYVILGFKNQLVAYSNQFHTYYLLMTVDGELEIVDENRLRLIKEEDIQFLFPKFTKHEKLGIFFEKFEALEPVLTQELKNVYDMI